MVISGNVHSLKDDENIDVTLVRIDEEPKYAINPVASIMVTVVIS